MLKRLSFEKRKPKLFRCLHRITACFQATEGLWVPMLKADSPKRMELDPNGMVSHWGKLPRLTQLQMCCFSSKWDVSGLFVGGGGRSWRVQVIKQNFGFVSPKIAQMSHHLQANARSFELHAYSPQGFGSGHRVEARKRFENY